MHTCGSGPFMCFTNLTLLKVTWQRYVDPKSNLIVLAKKRNEGFH